MLLKCGVGEDSWESLGLQGDPTSPFWRRSILGFLGMNDAKAETPVLWPPHVKSWLIGKDSDAGRDWGQEDKGTTEDEMARWHHGLDGRESEWTPGDGNEQGGLECCSSWGHKKSDTTEQLNWTENTGPPSKVKNVMPQSAEGTQVISDSKSPQRLLWRAHKWWCTWAGKEAPSGIFCYVSDHMWFCTTLQEKMRRNLQ